MSTNTSIKQLAAIPARFANLITQAVITLLFTLPMTAATLYVDYAGGSDDNPGNSTSLPWQHCPGDPRASGNAARTLSAGDTIVFRGGVTYSFAAGTGGHISANASGSAGSPITFRSGHLQSPQWGTTPAFIDGANASANYPSSTAVLSMGGMSWVTVEGLTIANATNRSDYTGLIGWYGSSGGNLTIQHCTLTNGAGSGLVIQGLWGAGRNPTNFTISDCVIHDVNAHCVFVRAGVDNVTITNCTLYRAGTQVYPGTALGDCICCYYGSNDRQSNIKILGNDLGSSATKAHLLAESPITGLMIQRNHCHGTNAVSAFIFNHNLTNVLCCNNLVETVVASFEGIYRFKTDTGANGGMICDGFRVYNDTIIATPKLGAVFYFGRGNCTSNTMFFNFDVRNCIVDDTTTSVPMMYVDANSAGTGPVIDRTSFICDYNIYNWQGQSQPFYWGTFGAVDFATWRATTGLDAHSATNQPAYIDYALGDYRLAASDNVARGKGVNLSTSISPDLAGLLRPDQGPWDIGAFQSSRTITPIPPKNLRVGK